MGVDPQTADGVGNMAAENLAVAILTDRAGGNEERATQAERLYEQLCELYQAKPVNSRDLALNAAHGGDYRARFWQYIAQVRAGLGELGAMIRERDEAGDKGAAKLLREAMGRICTGIERTADGQDLEAITKHRVNGEQ